MEINIENIFKVTVKLLCRPCKRKYNEITENIQNSLYQLIFFLLKKPLLATVLFSTFSVLLIIVLSASFITLMAVFVLVLVIILVGGFVFLAGVTIVSLILSITTLIAIIVTGIRYMVTK